MKHEMKLHDNPFNSINEWTFCPVNICVTFIPEINRPCKNITNNFCIKSGVSHYLKVATISGEEQEVPIIIPKSVVISGGGNVKNEKCVLGLVNHYFENSNYYDCLLHRNLF